MRAAFALTTMSPQGSAKSTALKVTKNFLVRARRDHATEQVPAQTGPPSNLFIEHKKLRYRRAI
jgi:hypothetical protein